MRNGSAPPTLEMRFNHTAFVVRAAFVAVLIAEVDFHPCDVISKSIESMLKHTHNVGSELLASFDVVIRIYLYIHYVSFVFVCSIPADSRRFRPIRFDLIEYVHD
jgi:hypothetical protein